MDRMHSTPPVGYYPPCSLPNDILTATTGRHDGAYGNWTAGPPFCGLWNCRTNKTKSVIDSILCQFNTLLFAPRHSLLCGYVQNFAPRLPLAASDMDGVELHRWSPRATHPVDHDPARKTAWTRQGRLAFAPRRLVTDYRPMGSLVFLESTYFWCARREAHKTRFMYRHVVNVEEDVHFGRVKIVALPFPI